MIYECSLRIVVVPVVQCHAISVHPLVSTRVLGYRLALGSMHVGNPVHMATLIYYLRESNILEFDNIYKLPYKCFNEKEVALKFQTI